MLNAYTEEIDDVQLAVQEVLAQLDLAALGQNSVGIIHCNTDFVTSGAIGALREALPFDLVGTTTMAAATGEHYGMYGLHLAVLTGDDAAFETAVTAPLSSENYSEQFSKAFGGAAEKLGGAPDLVFAFLPLTSDMSGAVLLERVSGLAEGAPVYGTTSCDVSLKQENCYTFKNGESDKRAAAFVLMRGAVKPRFIVTSLPAKNISSQKAVVTDSDGCLLKKVNDISVVEYLNKIGISTNSPGLSSVSVPIMVDYGGGSEPVAVRAYNILENGDLLCGAIIPKGAIISVGQIDRDGIIETLGNSLDALAELEDINGLFVVSCASRFITLTPHKDDEMIAVSKLAAGKIPFIFSYSGGEICPIHGDSGVSNRFHNYTFTACVF
jgi:hypothetical protein